MTKFALLIGSNYPNTQISLNSPLNNILYVKNELLKYEFNNENILLLNDTNSKYTNSNHHNIITLINALVTRSNVVTYYSFILTDITQSTIIKMKYIVQLTMKTLFFLKNYIMY